MPNEKPLIELSGYTEGPCVCAPVATTDRVLAVLVPGPFAGIEVMTFDGEVFAEAQAYGADAWLKVNPIVLGKLNDALRGIAPPVAEGRGIPKIPDGPDTRHCTPNPRAPE